MVERAQVFDTHKKSDSFNRFITRTVPDGHIVVASCMDECATELSTRCRCWFAEMGSEEIWKLGYRCAFAFIGVSGQKAANEKRATSKKETASVT